VRREYPSIGAKTATLAYLAKHLDSVPTDLMQRLHRLRLGLVEVEPWEEVVDPGGGEVEDFVACAKVIVELIATLAPVL
jgi:hypothetical protein